jgi:hypothetical protein
MSEIESAKYWLSWIEFGSTIALLLVALGVGFEFVADRLAAPLRRKIEAVREAEMVRLSTDLARAQRETADAQLRLNQAINRVDEKAGQRFIDRPRFAAVLNGRPKGSVRIWYKLDDSEAYMFASQIRAALEDDKWTVAEFTTIPIDGGDPAVARDAPADIRHGSGTGLTIRAAPADINFHDNTSAFSALSGALGQSRKSGGAMVTWGDPALSTGHFIVVVGQKQN